ncbi:hypothetical protein D3C85_708070 [compost metagenome]
MVGEPRPHQKPVEQTVVAEDAHPCVNADQDRGPGRHHDQQQQDVLRFLAGLGDRVGHRETDQQTHQRAQRRDLQRTEVGRQVQLVFAEHGVVADVEHQLEFLFGVGVDLRVRRDRQRGFRETDLHHQEERQHEEQEQPDERNPDDELAPAGDPPQELLIEGFHARSTTPLSSSHHT